MSNIQNRNFSNWITEVKQRVRDTQLTAALAVNTQLIQLYWELGKSISNKINDANWGSSIVDKLSKELKNSFPNQTGFSRTNLFNMKKFFEFYQEFDDNLEFVQQLVGQIPWGQNIAIISKTKSIEEADFYCNKTVENNWSRAVLIHQIESDLYNRQGKVISNFKTTLPSSQTELATEILKDPYNFDFLELSEKIQEKDIENQLVEHITSFLLELGAGFAFVGRQVPVKVDRQEFFLDLLFYHIKLKCYVVIELKATEFKPEFAGKLNFYLSAVDETLVSQTENPTIGLLLCKSKSSIVAEYALRGMTQPIGVSEYELSKKIPEELVSKLPSIEEIEREFSVETTKN